MPTIFSELCLQSMWIHIHYTYIRESERKDRILFYTYIHWITCAYQSAPTIHIKSEICDIFRFHAFFLFLAKMLMSLYGIHTTHTCIFFSVPFYIFGLPDKLVSHEQYLARVFFFLYHSQYIESCVCILISFPSMEHGIGKDNSLI